MADQDLVRLGRYMSNEKHAMAVKELVTNSNDPEAVAKFAKAAGVSVGTVNFAINRGNFLQ